MSQPDPLDLIRRQIVDLQERTTALEKTPPSQRPDGALEGLLAAGLKAVAGTVRTAAEAKAARTAEPSEPPAPEPTRPAVRDAVQRAAASVARAQAAAAPLFPITEPEPAAPFAGRTAPRRTLPPEAPVRLWNAEHTEHVDATAVSTMTPGVTRLLVTRGAEDALMWLRELDGGTFAAWLDREWAVAAWTHTPRLRSGDLTLDLLPLPKPPRVDEVLGREPLNIAEVRAGAEAMRATPPKTRCPGCTNPTEHGHYPWCAQAHPLSEALEQPEAYTMPDGVGLGTVPEYSEPVGTAHANIINTAPVDLYDGSMPPMPGSSGLTPAGARAIDEVLPMPGGPNDKLAQAVTRCGEVHFTGVRCMRPAGHNLRSGGATPHRSPGGGLLWGDPVVPATKRSGYGDLYARLPYLHDAVAEEES